jgi:deoxyribonuclease-4
MAERKKPKAKKKSGAKKSKRLARKAVKMLPAARQQTSKRAFNKRTDSAYDPKWTPPVFDDDVLIGAHVSIAGGTHEAPFRARATGASAMQIFTKMANRWAERTCEDDECTLFRVMMADTAVRQTVAHDSYLINLASPDPKLRRQSVESFVAELRRCEALGLDYLVSHPGNFIDDRASGLARNADGIAEALDRVPGKTVLCMETTAGSGTALGATFEELAKLFELIPAPLRPRMGVCVDTCHAYSAGYDLRGDFDGVWARFDDTVGRERLRVMHLNDSKTPFGSRRDRHELIAQGSLGELPFRRIMIGPRFDRIPKILETPKQNDATATDTRMILRLRGYRTA